MRIALSNSSKKWGGVHVITGLLASGLTRRGHDVVVLGAPGSALAERVSGTAPFEPVLEGMDLHPLAVWRARRVLSRYRVQAVLAMMKKDVRLTVPAAFSLGIPSVVRHANDRPLNGWLYDRLFFGALPALHIANSQATRATLLESASWLRGKPMRVILNGIDIGSIDAAPAAELGLPADAIVIAFAARMEYRKGILELAAAWRVVSERVPSAHLVLAGTGPEEAEARSILDNLPRTHWLGYRGDVPAVLKAADIVVMPSRWEGFGITAAEAMAARKPVVATKVSSLPEIVVDGQTGRLVPAGSATELAETLVELAADPELRRRMGELGRKRLETHFSHERMISEYEEALASVLRPSRTENRAQNAQLLCHSRKYWFQTWLKTARFVRELQTFVDTLHRGG